MKISYTSIAQREHLTVCILVDKNYSWSDLSACALHIVLTIDSDVLHKLSECKNAQLMQVMKQMFVSD